MEFDKESQKVTAINTFTVPFCIGEIEDPTENLVEDFSLVPIIADCTNTAHLPLYTFVTKEMQGTERQKIIGALSGGIINTYFSYAGAIDK